MIYIYGNKGEYSRVEINKKGTTKTKQSKKALLRDIRRWTDNLRNNKSLQEELDNSSFFDDNDVDIRFSLSKFRKFSHKKRSQRST